MTQLNRHQPERPRTIDGVALNYRTLPIIGDTFIVTTPFNMISAITLYRAVKRGEVPNFVAVSDLHEFLFPTKEYGLSKKTMGAVIVRTVRYNPRKLMGVSKKNDKVRQIYAFGHMAELQFGLEWMICTWLRKFLNDGLARGARPLSGPDDMSEELENLATLSEQTFQSFYIERLWQFRMEEPDWSVIALGLTEPELERETIRVDRPPLKSYR